MNGVPAIPDDVSSLLGDVDTFISQTLKGENLSQKGKEKREILLKKIKGVKARYLTPEEGSGLCCSTLTPLTVQGVTRVAAVQFSLPREEEEKPQCNTLLGERVSGERAEMLPSGNAADPTESTGSLFMNCQEQYPDIFRAYAPDILTLPELGGKNPRFTAAHSHSFI